MRKFSRGFTVIEVLVAIALTMVVGWLVSLAFNNASTACRGVTATLDYRAKGAAILDMLETDIANTSQYCQSVLGPTDTTDKAGLFLVFKTVLPRQRTHYQRSDSFNIQNGDYTHNIVSVRWQFNPGDVSKNSPSSLYRAVSNSLNVNDADDIQLKDDFDKYNNDLYEKNSEGLSKGENSCYAVPGKGIWNLTPKNHGTAAPDFGHNGEDVDIGRYLVTNTDIRDFEIVYIGGPKGNDSNYIDFKDGDNNNNVDNLAYNVTDRAGKQASADIQSIFTSDDIPHKHGTKKIYKECKIPRAYRVSFFLTNAPANVKSPRKASSTAEKEALSSYIWEYFDRTIATR